MTYLGTYDIPAYLLTPYPGNPRRGDVNAIRESIRTHGQYRALVVRAHNRDDPTAGGTVLAGNHTLRAIVAEHAETHADDPAEQASIAAGNAPGTTAIVRVEMHDVDDTTAAKIVAVDNRTGDLGDYDDRQLAELLGGLDDLAGTGYDEADLDILARTLAPPSLEELADEYGEIEDKDDGGELWPRLSIKLPPTLMAAWRAHLDTHSGDEVQAFAAALDVDPATL